MTWNFGQLEVGQRPTFLEAEYANEILQALNALGNITIKKGESDQVLYSDDGVAIRYGITSNFTGSVEVLDPTDITKKWVVAFSNGELESITQASSGYAIKAVEICEGGSAVSYDFVIKS